MSNDATCRGDREIARQEPSSAEFWPGTSGLVPTESVGQPLQMDHRYFALEQAMRYGRGTVGQITTSASDTTPRN